MSDRYGLRVKRLGPLRFVKWPKKAIAEATTKYKRYHFEFYGVGMFGYYIGFLNGRHIRDWRS